jgi:hypothetical protein
MPTLDPKFEIGGMHGDTEPAAQARAVYAAGFTGSAASAIVLRGNTPAMFDAALKEARDIRGVARIASGHLVAEGLDNEAAIEAAIVKGIPLATVRKDITDMLARMDEDSHIDTSPKAAAASDIYAQRAAQIDASRGKHG